MRTPHLLIEEVFHHMYSTLLLDITGNLATLTLNRPEKRNAISTQMMAELQTALDHIEKSHARVAIVTGSGKAFSAGMDLDMLAAIAQQSPAENQEGSPKVDFMRNKLKDPIWITCDQLAVWAPPP